MEYVTNSEKGLAVYCRGGEKKKPGLTAILSAAGVAACIVFTIYGIKTGLFTSQEAMEHFLKQFGLWGPVMFVLIQVIQVVVPIIPGGISCLGGVLLFGPVWGFVYNYLGICIGSACAFLISRRVGMPAVERVAGGRLSENPKFGKYLKWMDNGRFDGLFAAAIFFPAAPDDFLCFLAGVTKMSFRKFMIIILLGKPLSIVLYSLGLQMIFDKVLALLH